MVHFCFLNLLYGPHHPLPLPVFYLTAKIQEIALKFLHFLFNCWLGCDFSKRGIVIVLNVHVVSLTLFLGSKSI